MKNHWQEDVGTHRKKKKKDTPCPGTKEKPLQDSRRGTIMLKSNPLPAGWVTHKLKKFSHCCKHSRLHIRLDNQGVRQRDRESQGIWLWRTAGFHYRTSTGLWETETLGRYKQNLVHTRTQGKGVVTPQESEPDACECLKVSCGGVGQQWPAAGTEAMTFADLGGTCWPKSFWRSALALPQSL